MVFYTSVLKLSLKNGQRKEDDTFLRKKADEKQNSATIMISLDEKRCSFSNEVKIARELFE